MKMNENAIRSLILAPGAKEKIKQLMLTDNHVKTLELIGEKGITSAELSAHQKTYVQAASQLLNNIWRKGYLDRKELKSTSGGIEYKYVVKGEYVPLLQGN